MTLKSSLGSTLQNGTARPVSFCSAPRASRSQRCLQPATISPPHYAQEALRYCADLSDPSIRGLGSATDLANVEEEQAHICIPGEETLVDIDQESERVMALEHMEVTVGKSRSSSASSLNTFFDELASDMGSIGADRSHAVDPQALSKRPIINSMPRKVLPASVAVDMPAVHSLPELPRTVTLRPRLPDHRSQEVRKIDEWLLQPQPTTDVTIRLRRSLDSEVSASTGAQSVAWTPGRLLPLLLVLTEMGAHATLNEVVSFACKYQPQAVVRLDLSDRMLARYPSQPVAAHVPQPVTAMASRNRC
jgi:hypothetical protein